MTQKELVTFVCDGCGRATQVMKDNSTGPCAGYTAPPMGWAFFTVPNKMVYFCKECAPGALKAHEMISAACLGGRYE